MQYRSAGDQMFRAEVKKFKARIWDASCGSEAHFSSREEASNVRGIGRVSERSGRLVSSSEMQQNVAIALPVDSLVALGNGAVGKNMGSENCQVLPRTRFYNLGGYSWCNVSPATALR
jgi:hypothetical protein